MVSKAEFSKVLAVFSKVARGRVWYLGYIGVEAGNGRIRLRGSDMNVYLRVDVPAQVSAEGGDRLYFQIPKGIHKYPQRGNCGVVSDRPRVSSTFQAKQ